MSNRARLIGALIRVLAAGSLTARARAVAKMSAELKRFERSAPGGEELPPPPGLVVRTRALLDGASPPVAAFTDAELGQFNSVLPWASMTVDPGGRLVGSSRSAVKRANAHLLLERRLTDFAAAFPLEGKHVVELGCFEGIHTLGLLLLGARVTAFDGRMENLLKTIARLWAYGRSCEVRLWDFDRATPACVPAEWDVLHHIGVLYHLSAPVEHLDVVLPRTRQALLLDTHVISELTEATGAYEVEGRAFAYREIKEPMADVSPFAGLGDHARYLHLEDLVGRIGHHGFRHVDVVSDRVERNGRRVTIWAFRDRPGLPPKNY